MNYKGYIIKKYDQKLPFGAIINRLGIFDGDYLIEYSKDEWAAKRSIDLALKNGDLPVKKKILLLGD